MKKARLADRIVVGGLHKQDFDWASREHEEAGYVFVGFVLDFDGYHWKAVYLRANRLEKALEQDVFDA
jgi:hypothetical protein